MELNLHSCYRRGWRTKFGFGKWRIRSILVMLLQKDSSCFWLSFCFLSRFSIEQYTTLNGYLLLTLIVKIHKTFENSTIVEISTSNKCCIWKPNMLLTKHQQCCRLKKCCRRNISLFRFAKIFEKVVFGWIWASSKMIEIWCSIKV